MTLNACRVFGHANSNGTGFEAVHSDGSKLWAIYICIILETAHHRTMFGIFCSFTQKTTPQENSHKMFHISSPIVLFSYWKVKEVFLEIRIKFHLEQTKERGKRRVCWGEAQNEGYVSKFPLLSKIQTLFHKLLVRQTSNHHHCNWQAQIPICSNFEVILRSSSWSKTALCILRNKYGFKIGNAMEKIFWFDSLSREGLSPSFSLNTLCR